MKIPPQTKVWPGIWRDLHLFAFQSFAWHSSFPVLYAIRIMHSVNELWLCIWDRDYHSTYYCWAWGADMYQRTNVCLLSGHQRAVHRFRCALLYISPPFLLLLHLSIHSFLISPRLPTFHLTYCEKKKKLFSWPNFWVWHSLSYSQIPAVYLNDFVRKELIKNL